MATHECDQVERLERIEADILNHRAWRTATTTQLTNIEIMMATANERMKNLCSTSDMASVMNRVTNLEGHADRRSGFRVAIVLTAIGLLGSLVWIGSLAERVKVNTEKWAASESHEKP